ncbi:hypothetical protein F8388_003041 [Cannabis sativa]|uniref:Ubiquitin-like protease family profile domain-containing protein n=1 Tax=Cannabis sativa TaxID=3483 RepID=A0A7J6GPC4_CANSA|nr:hypothetical protein F8388_003988 [Cannabis sativa]KAF4392621.1 hypothetical protein F8388_003041 [Cannabis sativa]
MISSIFIFPSTPSSYSFISHSSTPAIVLETTCQGNDRGSQFSKVVTKLKGMARKYNRKYKKRKSSTPYQKGLTFSKVMPKGAAKNTTFSTNEEGVFYKEITENIKEVADNRKELSENRKELSENRKELSENKIEYSERRKEISILGKKLDEIRENINDLVGMKDDAKRVEDLLRALCNQREKDIERTKVEEKKLAAQKDLEECINDLKSGRIVLSSPDCVAPSPSILKAVIQDDNKFFYQKRPKISKRKRSNEDKKVQKSYFSVASKEDMTSVYHSSSAEIPPTIIASPPSFSTLVETTVIKGNDIHPNRDPPVDSHPNYVDISPTFLTPEKKINCFSGNFPFDSDFEAMPSKEVADAFLEWYSKGMNMKRKNSPSSPPFVGKNDIITFQSGKKFKLGTTRVTRKRWFFDIYDAKGLLSDEHVDTSLTDCGVYLIKFVELLMMGESHFRISQNNVEDMRRKMAIEFWDHACIKLIDDCKTPSVQICKYDQ